MISSPVKPAGYRARREWGAHMIRPMAALIALSLLLIPVSPNPASATSPSQVRVHPDQAPRGNVDSLAGRDFPVHVGTPSKTPFTLLPKARRGQSPLRLSVRPSIVCPNPAYARPKLSVMLSGVQLSRLMEGTRPRPAVT